MSKDPKADPTNEAVEKLARCHGITGSPPLFPLQVPRSRSSAWRMSVFASDGDAKTIKLVGQPDLTRESGKRCPVI